MTTVKEIIIAALKEMGADGLCEGECGCGLDDLMPCFDGSCSVCVPAKEVPVPEELQGDYDRYFEPMTDDEITARNLDKKLCHDMGGCHRQQGSEGPHPDLHVHSFDIPRSHKMGGDEDEQQKPPEVRP